MDTPRPAPSLPPPSTSPEAGGRAGAAKGPARPVPEAATMTLEPVKLESVGATRRAPALLALFAVLALAVAGAIGAVVVWGGGSGDRSVAVEETSSYSLAAAAQQAAAASTVRFDMDMTMGSLGAVSVSGGIDTEAGLMTMTLGLDSMFGGGGGTGAFEAILDVGNGVMYMSSPEELGFPVDTGWVSMDLASIAQQSGMSLEEFQEQFAANPLDVARLFTDLDGRFVDAGLDSIDGETVRHYVVTVEWADVLAANPQLEHQLDLGGGATAFPESIDYDVWVTEDNQLRRMTFGFDVLGEEMRVEIDVRDVDRPLDVEIPAAGDVTDLTAFITGS